MQSQDNHYLIIAEKAAIKAYVDSVGARYTIPVVILKGNSGIDARYQIAERFRASGKRKLVLFVMTDCDPAGDVIAETTVHSLRDEFAIPNVEAIRVAMTHDQADELGLSAQTHLVCKDSSVTPAFIERHGRTDCYELDAVSPTVLQDMLDTEIRANINIERYNAEVEQQDRDNAAVRVRRQVVREAIAGNAELDYSDFEEDDQEGGAE